MPEHYGNIEIILVLEVFIYVSLHLNMCIMSYPVTTVRYCFKLTDSTQVFLILFFFFFGTCNHRSCQKIKWLQMKVFKVLRLKESLGPFWRSFVFPHIQKTSIHMFGQNSPTVTCSLLISSFYVNLNETRLMEIISMIM